MFLTRVNSKPMTTLDPNEGGSSGRAVARAAAAAIGGDPVVRRHYDASESTSVDIVQFRDRPSPGFSTYSTLSLHHATNILDGIDIRIEILGVASSMLADFPNLLATAAFYVIKDRWLCAPGVVFPNLLADYSLSRVLTHLLFVPPSPWETLSSVEVAPETTIHWLLAIPISDTEHRFLTEHGYNELEKLFDSKRIEYFDLERTPA